MPRPRAQENKPTKRKRVPTPLGRRLKQLRLERKLNQVQLAVEVGVSRAYISQIETGEEVPGRDTLMALAQFFDVSLDWLASGQGDRTPGAAQAQNAREALFLSAIRQLPEDEAEAHLQLLLKRIRPGTN